MILVALLVHGNYELGALRHGVVSVAEYLGTCYSADVRRMDQLSDLVMQQFHASGAQVESPFPFVGEHVAPPRKPSIPDDPSWKRLLWEAALLRRHNKDVVEANSSQAELLMFAEGIAVCTAMDRFLRVCLGHTDGSTQDLHRMLVEAQEQGIIVIPFEDVTEGVEKICSVRDTLLHANYAQAAAGAACVSEREYFRTQYPGEIETMHSILAGFIENAGDSTQAKGQARSGPYSRRVLTLGSTVHQRL